MTLALLVAMARRYGGAVGGDAAVTPVRISIAAAVASALLILIVLELIRGRRLKERYALLWLATGLVLLVLSLWRGGLNTIAGWLGVQGYPPAILFAAAIMFVIAVLLHYSTVLSRLTDDNVLLAQEVALLRTRVDDLEASASPASRRPARGAAPPRRRRRAAARARRCGRRGPRPPRHRRGALPSPVARAA